MQKINSATTVRYWILNLLLMNPLDKTYFHGWWKYCWHSFNLFKSIKNKMQKLSSHIYVLPSFEKLWGKIAGEKSCFFQQNVKLWQNIYLHPSCERSGFLLSKDSLVVYSNSLEDAKIATWRCSGDKSNNESSILSTTFIMTTFICWFALIVWIPQTYVFGMLLNTSAVNKFSIIMTLWQWV